MRTVYRHNALIILACVGFGLLVTHLLPAYWLSIVTMTLIYAYIASCWNIMAGFAGLISLGHMSFVGIGAYTSSILHLRAAISPWFGLVIGACLAAALAFIIGFLSYRMRLSHLSVSLMTLVVNQALVIVTTNISITGGALGLRIPIDTGFSSMNFTSDRGFLYLALTLVCFILCFSNVLRYSKTGYMLLALRDNERAAEVLGVPVVRYKLIATCLSAATAAAGGTFLAQYISFIDPPSIMSVTGSLEIIIFGFIGGMGSPYGPLLGTLLLYPLEGLLRNFFGGYGAGLNRVIFGVVLVVVSILAPRGIIGVMTNVRASRGKGPVPSKLWGEKDV